jgi:hypothetical protein
MRLMLLTVLVVITTSEEWRAFAARVREMFRIHDVKMTAAAKHDMGVDPAQFSRALDGDTAFDMRWLHRLPKDMRLTLHYLELRDGGLPLWVQTTLKAAAPLARKDVA